MTQALTGKPTKLDDGTWGVVSMIDPGDHPDVAGPADLIGKQIRVTAQSGKTWDAIIEQNLDLQPRGSKYRMVFITKRKPESFEAREARLIQMDRDWQNRCSYCNSSPCRGISSACAF